MGELRPQTGIERRSEDKQGASEKSGLRRTRVVTHRSLTEFSIPETVDNNGFQVEGAEIY